MSAELTPEHILDVMLQIERMHRTPGCYLYEAEPCSWCLWVREWAGYKTVELGLEHHTPAPDLSGYICVTCVKRRYDVVSACADEVVRGECSECKMERDLAHWGKWRLDE